MTNSNVFEQLGVGGIPVDPTAIRKWYKTEPQIDRQLQDSWEGYLEAVQNWMTVNWNEYAFKRPSERTYL